MSTLLGHNWWAGNSFSVVNAKVSLACVLGARGWKAKDDARTLFHKSENILTWSQQIFFEKCPAPF